MEKASVKHLEFQLQREKALTKDLDAKCKALSAQVAQLEQDKAELRREKLVLGEEAKRTAKLDDRIHNLQKEVESRDAVIAAERAAAQDARAEAEEVRRNANSCIALWTAAEEQWTADQIALKDSAVQYRSQIETLELELQVQRDSYTELTMQLQAEKDRSNRLTQAGESMEAEANSLHSQVEKLQNKVHDLEQTVYKLDLAGDKQREAINLKDTEIATLEATVARHLDTEERLEQTISSLNDRINAAKMLNLEMKGENEKLQCDLSDCKKEMDRLHLQIESHKRDANFLTQSQSSLQKALDDLKEKHRQLQEDVREKNVEVRRHELTISQLTVELKKSENQGGEWSFQYSSLESELQQTKEALKKSSASVEALTREKNELAEKVRDHKQIMDAKDEEMVVLQHQCGERAETHLRIIADLEKEIAARQVVINELSDQLNSASQKTTLYHTKILEESEASGTLREQLASLVLLLQLKEQQVILQECVAEKENIFAGVVAAWYEAPKFFYAQLAEHCQRLQGETYVLLKHTEELSRESSSIRSQMEELQLANADQKEQIAAAQKERDAQAERLMALSQDFLAAQNEVNTLRGAVETSGRENLSLMSLVAGLHEQVAAKGAELAEKDTALSDYQNRLRNSLDAASALEETLLSYSAAQMEKVQILWSSRLSTVEDFFKSVLSQYASEKASLYSAKEQADATCRELSAFVKEAKVSMNKSDLVAAERQEALVSRINLLEGQVALARREKDQAGTQLATLLRRFEEDKKAAEMSKKESKCGMDEERARREAAERECLKLRSGVEAEVKRKCEYKQALESLKKLRRESEDLRRAEKERAAEAIRKANTETNYWVMCFDHLKGLIDKSRRTGDRLPSIDPGTIHRLEVAKTKISPIQAREVNAAHCALPRLKRIREEASDGQV
ncbi:hypothetical protein JKF63_07330 [Porcisia hertigi]|uniref:Uncharacterized protein n=1 Tax=Porcisia hertigi TaxID=2761500 RepID=A0A836YGQ3_9TRYP|nr:hypothetical protein JKF63_07330 [Porcisia hertigi]